MPSFEFLGPWQGSLATVVFVIAVGVLSAWATRKGKTETPDQPAIRNYAFGQFADMSMVKALGENVEKLTMHMMKSAVAVDGMAGQVATSSVALVELTKPITKLCGLVEQMLVDMQEAREEQELATERQRGYEEGRRDADAHRGQQATPGRRTPPK
jgi:hypothetical protein